MSEWTKYEPGDLDAYIHPKQWGRDHWQTLLFAEYRALNYDGVLENTKMRANARLHREFAANMNAVGGAKEYPTRLKGGEEVSKHDDWSCLEDAAAFGLIELEFKRISDAAFNNSKARVRFTPTGFTIITMLRRHLHLGGRTGDFEWEWTSNQELLKRFWLVYQIEDPPPLEMTWPFH